MNRKFLEELGLEKETIDQVMTEHGKTVNDLKPAQEELDNLKQEKSTLESQLSDLQSTVETQETELGKIDDLTKEIESYKLKELKASIARQAKIPFELAGRLSGENEEELKADAENLAELVNKKQPLPMKGTEPPAHDEDEELKKMLGNLTKQGE